MEYSDIVSTLAFITALAALAWNIVRDYLANKTAIKLSIALGEAGNIRNSTTGLFVDAGSLLPTHKFDNPSMLVSMVNVGRKSISISSVGGESNAKKYFSIALVGLPKMLSPYEVFATTCDVDLDFAKKVSKNEIKKLWAIDTTGKKWFLSKTAWKRLRRTAIYINERKYL